MFTSYQRARILLVICLLVGFVIGWWVGKGTSIPSEPGHAISVLTPMRMAATLAAVLSSTLIGTVLAGRVHFDGGMIGAAGALMGLSARGGEMHDILMRFPSPSIFKGQIVEVVALYIVLSLGWAMLWFLHHASLLRRDSVLDGLPEEKHPLGQRLFAMVLTAVIMAVLLHFFAQNDNKKQVMVSVAISSFLATLAVHQMFPVSPSIFFWIAPAICAIAGYVMEFKSPVGWNLAMISQPLARPLPLDYASAGTFGALVAYWMSRRWFRDRAEQQAAQPAVL